MMGTARAIMLVIVVVTACSKKPAETGAGSAAPSAGSDHAGSGGSAAPAWTLTSAPVELTCGNQPLALGKAAAAGAPADERSLPRSPVFAVCRAEASVEAACTCLAAQVAQWARGTGVTAPATCVPAPQGNSTVRLVEVSNVPDEDSDFAGGSAFVLLAARGAAWSAVGVVEVAPAVDLSMTPNGSHSATIIGLDTRAHDDEAWVWVQSENQYSETGMGEQEVTGTAAISICVVPAATAQPAYCYEPVKLAAWDYVFTIERAGEPNACKVRDAAVMSVRLDSTGAVVIGLEAGVDKAGSAGRYRL